PPSLGPKSECERAVNSKRPVNLDLSKFHFPLPAITSILHRISGIIVFIGLGFLIWGFDQSLSGEEGFNAIREVLQGFLPKLILCGIVSRILYLRVAGIRQLLMDIGIGVSLQCGRLGAKILLVVAVVLIVLVAVWIW